MPYAFSRCHCEEALAEADVAIQSGSLCALPVVPLDCRVGAVPLLAMTMQGEILLSEAEEAASLGFHFGYPSAD